MEVWRGVLYLEVFIEMVSGDIVDINWIKENLVGVRPYRGEVVVGYFRAEGVTDGLLDFVARGLLGHLSSAVGGLAPKPLPTSGV
jgi:hypothetical protein